MKKNKNILLGAAKAINSLGSSIANNGSRKRFREEVKKVVSPTDWADHHVRLAGIEEHDFEAFIYCLQHGNSILEALKSLTVIKDISDNTPLTNEDVLRMVPRYLYLLKLLGFYKY